MQLQRYFDYCLFSASFLASWLTLSVAASAVTSTFPTPRSFFDISSSKSNTSVVLIDSLKKNSNDSIERASPTSLEPKLFGTVGVFADHSNVDNSQLLTTTKKVPASGKEMPKLVFDNYTSSSTYRSETTNFDDRGMWIFYEITNWFLHKIQPNDFPDQLLSDNDLTDANSLLESLKENYRQWIIYEQGYAIVGGVCLSLALLFTFCVLMYFCFCRTCCVFWRSPCNREEDDIDENGDEIICDKKFDSCKRHCYNAIVTMVVIVMGFSMVCAVMSNEHIHKAVSKLANNLRNNVDDLTVYKEDTNAQLKKLLINDYDVLKHSVESTLDVASDVIVRRTKELTGAVSLDHLEDLSKKAASFESGLRSVETSASTMQSEMLKLRNNLTSLRDWFADELHGCLNGIDEGQKRECQSALTLLENYRHLPEEILSATNFDELKSQLNKIVAYNISTKLHDAQLQFEDLKAKLTEKISKDRKIVSERLDDVGNNLADQYKNISKRIDEVDFSPAKNFIDRYQEDVQYYELFRWIGSLVICGFLILVIVFILFGLMFGVCGRRGGYYEDECCVWSKGGCCLCWGIFIGLLTLALFMSAMVGLFLIGGNSRTIVCQQLVAPEQNSGLYNIMSRYVAIMRTRSDFRRFDKISEDILREFNISTVVRGCAENRSLYNILELDRRYNLQSLKTSIRNKAYQELNSYLERIENFRVDVNFKPFLNEETEQLLYKIQNTDFSKSTPKFLESVRNNTELYDFADDIEILQRAATESNYIEFRTVLKTLVSRLETLDRENGATLRQLFISLSNNFTAVLTDLPSLTSEIPSLIQTAKSAETLLSTNLTVYVHATGKQFVDEIKGYIDAYLNRLQEQMDSEITSCQPLRRVASSVYVSFCDNGLNPFNGFWASIGICLLLSIPAIFASIRLRDLYNTQAPYVSKKGTSTRERGRNSRVNAFTTATDNYDYYSRLDDLGPSTKPGRNKTRSGWRTPSNSIYYSDINSFPPPPYYQTPSGRR